MNLRPLLPLLGLLTSSLAFAQADEWSTFPPSSPAPTRPAPTQQAKPAPAPASPDDFSAFPSSKPAAPAAKPAAPAPQPAAPAGDDDFSAFPSSKPAAPAPKPAAPAPKPAAPQPTAPAAPAGDDDFSAFPSSKPAAPAATKPAAPASPTTKPAAPAPAAPSKPAVAQPAPSPTSPPAAAKPAPAATKPAPAAAKPAPTAAKPSPATASPAANTTAVAATDAAGDEGTVLHTEETFLPGSEPHSPGTWGRAFNDPNNTRRATGAFGGIGLLHLSSADLGTVGLFRYAAEGEYFGSNNFPVRNAENVRTSGTFSISYVPFEFLEAYVGYSASANSNTTSSPTLMQALGDVTLGAKVVRKLFPGFTAGLDLRLNSFSGVGNQDVRRFAFGITPQALATFDARERWPQIPVRAHANLGVALDGTGGLVRQHTLSAAEEFALGINQYNRLTFGIGLEAPLPVVTPFIEYNLAVPLGVPDGELTAPDGTTVPVGSAMPSKLGLGVKVTALRDVTFLAAVDLGLTGGVGLGVPATPPFNLLFGVSFAVDPAQSEKTRVVERIREREKKIEIAAPPEPPKTAKVAGTVVDAQTKKPVPGVIVAMVGAGLPPVASDIESGKFITHELSPGTVKLATLKEGYKPVEQEVAIEAGQTAEVELALEAENKKSHLAFTITAEKKPVAAQVEIKTTGDQPTETKVDVPATATEPVLAEVQPGHYVLQVTAEGFLAQTREVQLTGGDMQVVFNLQPAPAKKLVIVRQDKIQILQQVHFAFNKATILGDSHSLLDQVVDAIVRNDIKRVRVEGHTDNVGTKQANMKLSEDRAKAIVEYLVASGIDRARLEAVGYGDTRPLAPNLTARGRELNRRVEFVITEK